jgi:predicted SprT family Zn-dependent metalloprotease
MRLDVAIPAAEFLLDKLAPHLVKDGWKAAIQSRPMKRFGQCRYTEKTIYLSEKFVILNDVARIELTIKHEIAHALVGPGHRHGVIWQQQAIVLGVPPLPCSGQANMPPPRWIGICPTCEKVFHYYRKPKMNHVRYCAKCGPERGVFVPTIYIPEKSPQIDLDDYEDEM